jgi:acetyl esterase/lipase
VAWTIAHIAEFDGDPAKVFVMGHSAGGYNAAMVVLDDRWLHAAGASISDVHGWIESEGQNLNLPGKN